MRWRSRVGWCIEVAVTAGCSAMENIIPHAWPVQTRDGSSIHVGHAAVSTMKMLQYLRSQSYGYDWAVMQKDYLAYNKQSMAVLIVGK